MVQPARIILRVDSWTSNIKKLPLDLECQLTVPGTAEVHSWKDARDESVEKVVGAGTVNSEEHHSLANLNIQK